jgi:hypothetical protein
MYGTHNFAVNMYFEVSDTLDVIKIISFVFITTERYYINTQFISFLLIF